MDTGSRRRQALAKIRAACDAIIRVAAGWQAAGRDTGPLSQPLVQIQEALAELEKMNRAVDRAKKAKRARRRAGG
jgi:hypothetical protein